MARGKPARSPEKASDNAAREYARIQDAIAKSYKAFPRQREFHNCRAKYRLFGGAAGPSKTKALLWEAIYQANRYPNVDTLLLRRTFPELEKSLLTYFGRDVPRDLYKGYNDSKHVVTWHNGSTTHFGYSASENDIYQYQGAEFLFIGIDELTLFTLGQWQFLTSRNRTSCKKAEPCMAGATNPGNIGHAWVKALWVDQRPAPGMDRPDQYDPDDYAFIRATLADNPIYKDDAGYRKTLEALPRHLRQAFLNGDWNVYAGQYFDLFDLRLHTARAEQLAIEPWWPRWISVDWGFEHPSAVYWHAARPDGVVVTYREFVANHLSPRMLAQAIAERTASASESSAYRGLSDARPLAGGERIGEIYLSPDAFARRTSDSTIAEQLGDVLAQNGLPRPAPADDDRVGGWMMLYQMLEQGKWIIADSCMRLIDSLPTLTRDPANVEDVKKMDGDDACLAQGTLVLCRHGLAPIEQVKRGDHVLTRRGWQEVSWSGMTAFHARRLGLKLSDGTKLVGTPSHRVLLNGQWARFDSARYGDGLIGCTGKSSSIGAAATAAIRTLGSALIAFTSMRPASEGIAYCTATSGGMLMGPSLLGTTSTTLMGIRSTTSSATLNALQHASTLPSALKPSRNWRLRVRGAWLSRGRWLRFGISRKRAGSLQDVYRPSSCGSDENARDARNAKNRFGDYLGVASAPMRASLADAGKWVSTTSKNVANAVASALRRTGTRAYDFVPVHVLGVTEETPGPVYNLTVQGQPEFVAGGVLVHNCDSARYGLKSRLSPGRAPAEQRVAERITAVDPTSRAIWMQRFLGEERRASRPAPVPRRKWWR